MASRKASLSPSGALQQSTYRQVGDQHRRAHGQQLIPTSAVGRAAAAAGSRLPFVPSGVEAR
eukprot:364011-Chlamydomonas_euryale.AAC.10